MGLDNFQKDQINPPVRLPNIAMQDLIFPLRCVERTLINDSESKGGGWGSGSRAFEAGVIHSLKRVGQDSALPAWHTGGTTATQIDYNDLR